MSKKARISSFDDDDDDDDAQKCNKFVLWGKGIFGLGVGRFESKGY